MLFYEPLFLTIFPAVYAFYLLVTGASAKKWTLLIVSTLFYVWGEPVFVLVLLASTAIDYALSFHLNDPTPARARRLALAAGIANNLGILIVYKYADFLADNLNLVLAPFGPRRIALLHLALPIGVSFVVFEKITYLVDIRRGVSRPAASFPDYMLFVMLFPKLLAGPIVKFHEVERSLRDRPVRLDDVSSGLQRFLWGLSRKVLLADPCGEVANAVFGLPAGQVGFRLAWLGVAAVVWGWGIAQYPTMLPGTSLTISNGAPTATLNTLLVLAVFAFVVVTPSFVFLFWLHSRQLLTSDESEQHDQRRGNLA